MGILRLTLLVNPCSGRGRTRSHAGRAARILQKAGANVDVVETGCFDDTVDAAETCPRSDIVVAVGGDGTANAVARGLLRRPEGARPPMGVIPCGRGNDFAATLGIAGPDRACALLLQGVRRRVDVGRADGGVFLGVAGAGFDSKVARRAQTSVPFLSGAAAYVYALLRTLSEFRPAAARVEHDGGAYEGPMSFAAVGNTDRYGGGMRITPRASLEDGLLDLCLVKDVSRTLLLWLFPRVFSGTHVGHPKVFYRQTRWVTIEYSEPAEVFADGEFLQPTPVRIEVAPAALEVIAPAL